MSTAAPLQTHAAKSQPSSNSNHAGLLLQRKCACGSPTASLTGECAECKSKKRLQTKLTIGASNDPLEQEADRVADQVLAAPAHSAVIGASPRIQRFTGPTGECGKCRETRSSVQRRSRGQIRSAEVPSIVHDVLRSPGQPLDAATRNFMEPRFGHDFGRVRVHTDVRAAESARAVNALAYTVGHDVVFGTNKYAPASQNGRGLLAHELAHTIQQRSASGAPPSADPHGIFESSADAAGRDIAQGQRVSGDLPGCGVGLARAPDADAERDAAEKEALAYLARMKEEEEKERREEEENVASIPMALGGKKLVRKRPTTRPSLAPDPREGEYERLTAPLFAEIAEDRKRIDEQINKEREIGKRSYQSRLLQARRGVRRKSEHWYSPKEADIRITGEDVWREGFNNDLFTEREKRAVYEDQGSIQQLLREEQEERARQSRADFEIKEYNEHVARGDQLSAPGPIVTSFALPGLRLVGVALAGAQTGLMVGQTINACRHGTAADCAAAAAPVVAAAIVHKITQKGSGSGVQNKPPTPPTTPPGSTTIKANPPPPPARPPALTIKSSPPPPPVRTSTTRGPAPVTDAEVVASNVRNPSSIKPQDPTSHQKKWQELGGSPGHTAPLAYRDPAGNILVSTESWLLAPARNVRIPPVSPGAPIPTPPRVTPTPQPTPTPAKQNIGTADTGQAPAVVAPDPLAKTPPVPPPAPPVRQPSNPNPPAGGRTGLERTQTPLPEGPQIVRPQAISPEGVQRIQRLPVQTARKGRGNSVNYSVDHDRHQLAWQRLGGHNDAPPAFIYDGQVYLDPSRWPPKIP